MVSDDLYLIWAQFGDQRAKDLIDRNEGETDPRRAIRRLHRALSYGRTSIQAKKAYQDLGRYYEELGNVPRAILYYTKTIELGEVLDIPSVPALYWRGILYYQRGDWQSACRDFARARDLEGTRIVFPFGRALADRILTDLEDYGPQALAYGSYEGVLTRTAAMRKHLLALQEQLGDFELDLNIRYVAAAPLVSDLLHALDELHTAVGDLRNENSLYDQQSRGQFPIRLCFLEQQSKAPAEQSHVNAEGAI